MQKGDAKKEMRNKRCKNRDAHKRCKKELQKKCEAKKVMLNNIKKMLQKRDAKKDAKKRCINR